MLISRQQEARFRTAFPDLNRSAPTHLGQGWDHDIWRFGDEVVRAPLSMVQPGHFRREAAFLAVVGRHVDASTPVVTRLSSDATLLAYRMLPGEQLTEEKLMRLPGASVELVTGQIARFLGQLHSIPVTETEPLRPIVRRAEDHVRWLKDAIEQHLRGAIPDTECDAFEAFLPTLDQTIRTAPITTVLHGDFGLDSVLWDGARERIALIDFSDWALGDPAFDFAGLTWSSVRLARDVLEQYVLKDPVGDVIRRARVYNQMIAGSLLIHALLGSDVALDDARGDFRNLFGLE